MKENKDFEESILKINNESRKNNESLNKNEIDSSYFKNKGFKRIFFAGKYSFDGLKVAIKESGFREIIFITIISTICAIIFGKNFTEKIILILPGFICIITELLNSAIENAVDFTSKDIHPLAKKAKDLGSAAQFIALVFLALTWILFVIF